MDSLNQHFEYNILGLFLLDTEGKVVDSQLFPKNPKTVAKKIKNLQKGQVIPELEKLLNKVSESVTLYTSHSELIKPLKEVKIPIEYSMDIKINRKLRHNLPSLAIKYDFIENEEEWLTFTNNVLTIISKDTVHDVLSEKEILLMPTVQLLDDLDRILNSLSGRMREWYGIHFPEMNNRIKKHDDYAKIINYLGTRNMITQKALQELSFKKTDSVELSKAASTSIGANLDDYDTELVQELTKQLTSLENYREKLVEYITSISVEVAPNVCHIAGSLLGAKLIVKAGGLRKMAMMPSSTIQLLGAEKALYRAITTNAKPPKHGLLFQHPYVHNVPRNKRGARARSIASKIAIAARADEFSGDFIAPELLAQLEKN